MAHFAQLDENNVVTRVIVVDNKDIIDPHTGKEDETLGITFCKKLLGGNWKQTSYNSNIRKHYAGVGYSYNEGLDAFVEPQPHSSWTLDSDTATWYPPSTPGAAPTLTDEEEAANKYYVWNESNYNADPATAWVLTTPE